MRKWLLLSLVLLLAVTSWADPRDRAEVEREIALLNSMLELQQGGWTADVNPIAFLSEEELQGMLGLQVDEVDREQFAFNAAEWPAEGNEVLVENLTEVKNQAKCGSCVSFGTTACFEQTYWAKNNKKVLFSERYLFFCSPYTGYGCNGGWSLNGGAVAASNSSKGMIENDECPYYSNGTYHYDCGSGCNSGAKKYTMPHYRVSANDYIKVLDKNRAIIIGMIVFNDFRYYKSGIYEHLEGQRLGGHCMALVGYGTTKDGKHYWVIKNSWDKTWGDNGFIRVLIKSEQKYKDSNVEDYGGYAFE